MILASPLTSVLSPLRGEGGKQRREGEAEQALHFGSEFVTVLLHERERAAWEGVRVCAAADGDECHRAGLVALDGLLRVAGPVAADVVELAAQRRAVARAVRDERAEFAVRVGDAQDGQRVIGGAAGVLAEVRRVADDDAAVAREAGFALRPRKLRRLFDLPASRSFNAVQRTRASLSNARRRRCAG